MSLSKGKVMIYRLVDFIQDEKKTFLTAERNHKIHICAKVYDIYLSKQSNANLDKHDKILKLRIKTKLKMGLKPDINLNARIQCLHEVLTLLTTLALQKKDQLNIDNK